MGQLGRAVHLVEDDVLVKGAQDPSGRPTIMVEVTPGMRKQLLSVKRESGRYRLIALGVEEGEDPDGSWVRLRAKYAFQWPSLRAKLAMH